MFLPLNKRIRGKIGIDWSFGTEDTFDEMHLFHVETGDGDLFFLFDQLPQESFLHSTFDTPDGQMGSKGFVRQLEIPFDEDVFHRLMETFQLRRHIHAQPQHPGPAKMGEHPCATQDEAKGRQSGQMLLAQTLQTHQPLLFRITEKMKGQMPLPQIHPPDRFPSQHPPDTFVMLTQSIIDIDADSQKETFHGQEGNKIL